MTESELEIFRLKVKIEVHQVLLRMLYTGLAGILPNGPQALREKFQALRQEHSKIVLPTKDPAYSDALSAEYQEALDDALSHIESGFRS